jgi:hypothetical protein
MSEEEIEDCFCFVHQNEEMNHYRECMDCNEKLCELCIANDIACECGNIKQKDRYKKIYITKGEIEFELCISHLGYQCHYYCNTCLKYICILCSRDISHKSHKIILIEDYIQLQSKNISNQKENIQKVLETIKIKETELDSKREQLINYLNESKQKIQQNLQKFFEYVNESLQEKKNILKQNSVSDIIALRNELLFRKQELENRKRYIVNFQKFIDGICNLIQIKLMQSYFLSSTQRTSSKKILNLQQKLMIILI